MPEMLVNGNQHLQTLQAKNVGTCWKIYVFSTSTSVNMVNILYMSAQG